MSNERLELSLVRELNSLIPSLKDPRIPLVVTVERVNLSKDGKLLESRKRHLGKTITWRLVGTLDTIILAWLISGNPLTGLKIGFSEVITKMVFYYIHERLWHRSKFGLEKRKPIGS